MTGDAAVPALVVALHDGFYSCGSGAGRSNRAFLEVLPGMLRPGVRLAVLPVHVSAASSEYHPGWHATTTALCRDLGAEVIPVGNGSGGQVRFGGPGNFRAASASAAEVINSDLAPGAGPLLVVAFDVPFYGLTARLIPDIRDRVVVVARSTAALQSPDDLSRIAWECDGLSVTAAAGGRIAAISAHMRQHLATRYAIPGGALIDLANGLTRAEWATPPPDNNLLPAPARGGAGFVLAMGRAVACKGFDDLLDALALLAADGATVPHPVIAAVTDGLQYTAYQEHLARKIAGHGLEATLLTRFDPQLPRLLAHPALAAVVVPSRAEPFGRIPLEAFAAGAAPVVSTTAGGLAELVTDGHTGYSARPGDPASLAAALRTALACSPAERARMRAAGRRVAARYDYETAVARFFAQVAPWAVQPPDDSEDTFPTGRHPKPSPASRGRRHST